MSAFAEDPGKTDAAQAAPSTPPKECYENAGGGRQRKVPCPDPANAADMGDYNPLKKYSFGEASDASHSFAKGGGGDTAEKIAKQQAVMNGVSIASDVAAVGAVGATAVSQLVKDNNQADSVRGVAELQRVAGYAGYATGATDIALGMVGLAQGSKLKKVDKGTGQDATQKTNQAAVSHILYGAAKAAAGLISMKLADSNEKQAENMQSLSPGGGNGNSQVFLGADGKSRISSGSSLAAVGKDASSEPAPGAATRNVSTSGASAYVPDGNGKQELPLGGAPAASASGLASSTGSGVQVSASGGAQLEAGKSAGGGHAVVVSPYSSIGSLGDGGGGGTANYGGGGGGGGPDFGSILSSMFGSNSPTSSAAAEINPKQLYEDAVTGRDPAAQNVAIVSQDQDLFDVVRKKHQEMLEKGRLLGPKVTIQSN